jgi:hypothetical protein
MKRFFSIFLLCLSLIGCSQNKDICKCIELGNEVNTLSSSFFDREYSVLGKDSLDALIQQRDEWCEPFKDMSGEQMLQKLEDCPGIGQGAVR